MTRIELLVQGYARAGKRCWRVSPAAVLIEEGDTRVVVDPGGDAPALLAALRSREVSPRDISLVFVTHHHLDHVLNIRLFPETPVCDGANCFNGEQMTLTGPVVPGTSARIVATPGHCREHWSLLADTLEGTVAVAGDVLWWTDKDGRGLRDAPRGPDWLGWETRIVQRAALVDLPDSYAENAEALRVSRERLFENADIVIPGHGPVLRLR